MRIHHIMLRIGNLETSINFYTNVLGMSVLAQREFSDARYTIAFLGYGKEEDGALIELTYNWNTNTYNVGNGFGHFAIEVSDVYKMCDEIRLKGAKIVREPGTKKYGTKIIAFIEDPDGYKIELYEKD